MNTLRIRSLLLFLFTFCLSLSFACSDEDNGTDPQNHPPVILSIEADPDTIYEGQVITVTVGAEDTDGDDLEYSWECSQQWLTPLSGSGNRIQYGSCCAIEEEKTASIVATVSDGRGGEASDSVSVWGLPVPE